MPKIIYRPNPSPPPFDPPTPPVQNPSVHFNPYPFNPDELLQIVLTNLDLPATTTTVRLSGYVEQWQDETTFFTSLVSSDQTTIETTGASEASSSQISRYVLYCYHVEGSEWTPLSSIEIELLN